MANVWGPDDTRPNMSDIGIKVAAVFAAILVYLTSRVVLGFVYMVLILVGAAIGNLLGGGWALLICPALLVIGFRVWLHRVIVSKRD